MRVAGLLAAAALALSGAAAGACTVNQASLTHYPGSVTTAPAGAAGGPVTSAWYDDPVTRYRHNILGRGDEPASLWVNAPGNHGLCGHRLELDAAHVFEDVAPRLADLDGDGTAEVITVRSHLQKGAQLAVYRWDGAALRLAATTPYIGRAHRWLAPAGVADLDGDGAVELAFVDRPHLARVLRIWRYRDGALEEVTAAEGFTNHAIGEATITGGVRDCGAGPELVLLDAARRQVMAVRLAEGRLSARPLRGFEGPGSVAAAMDCR
jgi:hypothetical protein